MERFVVAITRRCGSGGTAIGHKLAEELGISVYDRELLRLASDESGINEALFAKADEETKKSLLYRISRKVYKGELIPPDDDNFVSNENLFNYQAKVLKELADNESFVVIGRAAGFVLRGRPNVLSVYLHAPMEDCIRRECERFGFSEEDAIRHIHRRNKHRSEYFTYHTGLDWEDVNNYDLSVNTAAIGHEKTVTLLKNLVSYRLEQKPG